MHTLDGVFLPRLCQVEIDHGGFEVCMAQGTLHGAEVAPRFTQRRGIGMPAGMGAAVSLTAPGALFGCAQSAWDAAAGPRGGGTGHVFVLASGSGQEPGGVAVRFPGGA